MSKLGLQGLLLACGLVSFVPADADAQKRRRDVITREEILSSPQKDLDLYMAVRALRPTFLEHPKGVRTLGGSMGMAPLVVYIGSTRQTGIDVLKSLMAQDVLEVRYLDPSQSESRYGLTANGGALVIKLEDRIPIRKDSLPGVG